MRGLGIRVGMALLAGDTGGGVLPMVEGNGVGQGGFTHPAKRLARIGRVVGVGRGVQGQQARVVCQDVAVTVQAGTGRWHACFSCSGSCGMAGSAIHTGLIREGMGLVRE